MIMPSHNIAHSQCMPVFTTLSMGYIGLCGENHRIIVNPRLNSGAVDTGNPQIRGAFE